MAPGLALSFPFARPALAQSPRGNVRVLLAVLVAVRAVCFAAVGRAQAFSAKSVYAGRHWLHVIRVNALSYAAQVVKLHPFRNLPDQTFIQPPVGKHGPTGVIGAATDTKSSVAAAFFSAHPKPAIAVGFELDEAHEAVKRLGWFTAGGITTHAAIISAARERGQ